jgi:hypothetical protein
MAGSAGKEIFLPFEGRHGILIFSCLLFVPFEKIENLIKKRHPDILHQIAKSRNLEILIRSCLILLGH